MTDPEDVRTSRTRSRSALGGTAQISVNCAWPPLL